MPGLWDEVELLFNKSSVITHHFVDRCKVIYIVRRSLIRQTPECDNGLHNYERFPLKKLLKEQIVSTTLENDRYFDCQDVVS